MKIVNFVLIYFCFFTPSSWAIYVDATFSVGRGDATIEEGQKPELIHYKGSAAFAFNFESGSFFGLGSGYRKVEHRSDKPGELSFDGVLVTPFSFIIGMSTPSWLFKADFKPYGEFDLNQKSTSGDSVAYTDLFGIELSLGYKLLNLFYIGGFYESLSFSQKYESSIGNTLLTEKQKFTTFGVFITFSFSGNALIEED